jgi:hypothetical protein
VVKTSRDSAAAGDNDCCDNARVFTRKKPSTAEQGSIGSEKGRGALENKR